ncbi:MAG TPA: hypothetical protein VH593_31410 [Ktedonobacteraceae bacterium]|jgi:hypothetical protein
MKEYEIQRRSSSTAAARKRYGKKMGDLEEEPEQRWQAYLRQQRDEKIRILTLALALLLLFVGILLDLFTGAILPLLTTLVVAYLGYRGIDAWLEVNEQRIQKRRKKP